MKTQRTIEDPAEEGMRAARQDAKRMGVEGFLFATATLEDPRLRKEKTKVIIIKDPDRCFWVYGSGTQTERLAEVFSDRGAQLWVYAASLNRWVTIPDWKEEE